MILMMIIIWVWIIIIDRTWFCLFVLINNDYHALSYLFVCYIARRYKYFVFHLNLIIILSYCASFFFWLNWLLLLLLFVSISVSFMYVLEVNCFCRREKNYLNQILCSLCVLFLFSLFMNWKNHSFFLQCLNDYLKW